MSIDLKIKALELANQHTAAPGDVVKRAEHYHNFLSGTASVSAASSAAPTTAKTNTGGAATTTATKPTGDKAAAAKPAADKATKPTGDKAAAAKPAADKAAAAKVTTNPPANTAASDDGLTMNDVSAALQKVLNSTPDKEANKLKAYKILGDVGKVKSVREVKPTLYKAVIDACAQALSAPAESTATAAATDDFGAPISSSEAVDTDPPEQTGSGASADGGEDL